MQQYDPIDNVIWIPSRELNANDYNPNVVFSPELRLLEQNILTYGWTQAIIISPEYRIIDGFHRWRLSMDSAAIRDRWAESIPCVVVKCTEAEAKVLTVTMNRAKGTHVAVRMSDLVQSLLNEHGMSMKEVGKALGATQEEVRLLADGSLLKSRNLKDYKYSKAWVPVEVPVEEEPLDFEREDIDV